MEMLQLAIKSRIPLIYIKTDDIINVGTVLDYLENPDATDEDVVFQPLNIPETFAKASDIKAPKGKLFYTSSECKSLVKLYHWAVDQDVCIVFVNTERSVLQFDGGTLVPPKELVRRHLAEVSDEPDNLLPAFGGMTLKDVGEVAKMTMTRDSSLTPQGVNQTRGGYRNLKGIQQVSTELEFYEEPWYLTEWLKTNASFFMNPIHESLTPRGLLFDGPPGTGKTLASKAIAAKFGVPLYRLDIGAMKGKYVGDSEGNLLAALTQVDQVEPCVVIFDEVEKVFQSTGDSGVTSSMLSQILWWLQEHKSKVFTVMTTNDRNKIPKELYREGRIDRIMEFLGIENMVNGCDFAKGAFDAMLATLGGEAEEEHYTELYKRIKLLFADGVAVPQSRITKDTYDFVRELLAESTEETQEVANEEGAQNV